MALGSHRRRRHGIGPGRSISGPCQGGNLLGRKILTSGLDNRVKTKNARSPHP